MISATEGGVCQARSQGGPLPSSLLLQIKTPLAFCGSCLNMICVGEVGDTTEKGVERTAGQSLGTQSGKGQRACSAFGHHLPTQLAQLWHPKSEFFLPGMQM